MARQQDGDDIHIDRDHALEERLDRDQSREGGYATPRSPMVLRAGGTLRINNELMTKLDQENIKLKAENGRLRKQLALAAKKGGR